MRRAQAASSALGVAFGLVLVVTGCSSSGDRSDGAGEPTVPRPTVALSDANRTKPSSCEDSWIAASTGRVVTDGGEVLVGATVAYCASSRDTAVCLPWVKTAEGGWYTVLVPPSQRCVKSLSVRVVPPDGRRLSDAYCAPSVDANRGELDLSSDLRVYSLRAPRDLPPLGDKTAPRTVAFDDGLEVTFAPDDMVEGDQYEALSAGPMDDERPCFVPPGLAMDALYAFGPAMNVSIFADRPKARFKLPNPKKLPEGTAVELFVLGGNATQLDADHAIDEGAFVSIGQGHVTGGLVVPDPASELPALTVVGYRQK